MESSLTVLSGPGEGIPIKPSMYIAELWSDNHNSDGTWFQKDEGVAFEGNEPLADIDIRGYEFPAWGARNDKQVIELDNFFHGLIEYKIDNGHAHHFYVYGLHNYLEGLVLSFDNYEFRRGTSREDPMYYYYPFHCGKSPLIPLTDDVLSFLKSYGKNQGAIGKNKSGILLNLGEIGEDFDAWLKGSIGNTNYGLLQAYELQRADLFFKGERLVFQRRKYKHGSALGINDSDYTHKKGEGFKAARESPTWSIPLTNKVRQFISELGEPSQLIEKCSLNSQSQSA